MVAGDLMQKDIPTQVPLDVVWLEDDAEFAEVGRRILELGPPQAPEGQPAFRPVLRAARSIDEALRHLEDQLADVIVTDLNVTDSSGSETILRLREKAPFVPLVVLTGMDDPETSMLVAFENADFLCKDELNARTLWRSIYMAITRAGVRS